MALRLVQAGPQDNEITASQAEIDRLTTRQRYLQELIRRETVVNPITGIVTTPQLDELLYRRVERGERIAEVQQLNSIRVGISVSEKELGDVHIGRHVDLRVRAYPDRGFSGEVVDVAPPATSAETGTEASRRFVVTTFVNNESLLLKPGMTCKAKIRCGERRVFDVIVRKLSHYVRVEFWSWW